VLLDCLDDDAIVQVSSYSQLSFALFPIMQPRCLLSPRAGANGGQKYPATMSGLYASKSLSIWPVCCWCPASVRG
jgi:hypothetical protein